MSWRVYCNHRKLEYDEACLRVNTTKPISLYGQVTECFKCDLYPLAKQTKDIELIVSTVYPTQLLATTGRSNCSLTYHFSQLGVYGLNVTRGETDECLHIYDISAGSDVDKPLWVLLGILTVGVITYCLFSAYTKLKFDLFRTNPAFRDLQNDLGEPSEGGSRLVGSDFASSSPSPTPGYRHRVKAIDTFRGITIALMIFINSGGGKYAIFEHSPWNGLTVADLIFPWFVWIMGFSTVMSVKNHIRADRRRLQLFTSTVRRSITLFALGIVLNSLTTNDLNMIRLPGVLQRIALTYFIISSLEICFVTPEFVAVGNSFVDKLSDILSCWVQWLVILAMVGVHTLLTFRVAFEHCPAGYLGPGGLSDHSRHFNCTGGVASYVDRMVFTPNHMYKHPTPQTVYRTVVPVDPEGLLGVLTCCLTAFLGVQAGQTLLSFYNPNKRLSRWIIWAFLTGLIGSWLTGFSRQGGLIPVNKNLWSLSYSLVASSSAFIALLILYLLVDHLMLWNGAPFIHTGRNSILLYFGSCIIGEVFPFQWKALVDTSTHSEYLFMNIFGTTLWIIISCILARYKFYLTV